MMVGMMVVLIARARARGEDSHAMKQTTHPHPCLFNANSLTHPNPNFDLGRTTVVVHACCSWIGVHNHLPRSRCAGRPGTGASVLATRAVAAVCDTTRTTVACSTTEKYGIKNRRIYERFGLDE